MIAPASTGKDNNNRKAVIKTAQTISGNLCIVSMPSRAVLLLGLLWRCAMASAAAGFGGASSLRRDAGADGDGGGGTGGGRRAALFMREQLD